MFGQELGGALANEANAKTVNYTLQRELLGPVDLIEDVLGRLVAHTFQFQQIILGNLVNISDVLN